MNLVTGDLAPKINAKDHNGIIRSSEALRDKSLILFFYPKDHSPGCTKQACGFRDNYSTFKFLNAEIWGISSDTDSSHKNFINNLSLPFPLISDRNHKIGKLFGIKYQFGFSTERITFLIDKEKKIRLIHKNLLDSNSHVKESLRVLEYIFK